MVVRQINTCSDFRMRRNTICAAQNQWLSAASLAGNFERLSSSRPLGRGQRVIDSRLAQPPLMPEHLTAEWRLSQYGNGVADSLPSGLGNLDLQLGRRWMPLTQPLQTFEPVQDPIDLTTYGRLHPKGAVRNFLKRNARRAKIGPYSVDLSQ
jgi:hypothetical protein